MEVNGQLYVSAVLPYLNSPWYPMDRARGGPISSLDAVVEGQIFILTGNKTPIPMFLSP
jgi:hypothetical protein